MELGQRNLFSLLIFCNDSPNVAFDSIHDIQFWPLKINKFIWGKKRQHFPVLYLKNTIKE